jgi:xanthosine utilization system XapX-like protein
LILKFLHIAIMFAAVAVAVGGELILLRAVATRNVVTIRGTFGAAAGVMRWIPAIFGVGALVGIIAALVGAFNPLAPWLIAAYVLFAIAMAVGGQVGGWAQRVGMAAAASPAEEPSGELQAAIDDPRARIMRYVNWAIVIGFIWLMVFKPGA